MAKAGALHLPYLGSVCGILTRDLRLERAVSWRQEGNEEGRIGNSARNESGTMASEPSPADVTVAGIGCIPWGTSSSSGAYNAPEPEQTSRQVGVTDDYSTRVSASVPWQRASSIGSDSPLSWI